MKQLHAARDALEAHLIRGVLTSHGIAAEVRGEYLTSGMGELPLDVCSVWIHDDAQLTRARELLDNVLSGNLARELSGEGWTCGDCGESLEGQFTACWRCGAVKR